MEFIKLEANPSDAPGCVKLVAEDGRSRLIQTDWDWPGIARAFGWSTEHCFRKSTLFFDPEVSTSCSGYDLTDGTIDCPTCKKSASSFIEEARQYIDDHDGDEIEDPGYLDGVDEVEPELTVRDITDDEFDDILHDLVAKMSASTILSYGDVYVILREELNNEVLEVWERRQKDGPRKV
jgi:hypothetical protein